MALCLGVAISSAATAPGPADSGVLEGIAIRRLSAARAAALTQWFGNRPYLHMATRAGMVIGGRYVPDGCRAGSPAAADHRDPDLFAERRAGSSEISLAAPSESMLTPFALRFGGRRRGEGFQASPATRDVAGERRSRHHEPDDASGRVIHILSSGGAINSALIARPYNCVRPAVSSLHRSS